MHSLTRRVALLSLIVLLMLGLVSQALAAEPDIKLKVEEFTLDNGMLFLIVERPVTPQVACRVAIRAGSALEERGKTGIAHLLEHMMFKGTKNLGTLDVEKDQKLQAKIEQAYQAILAEKQKRRPDMAVIEAKAEEMEQLRCEVQKIYVPQAFSSQLGKNGAEGINAFTSHDETQYVMSVPSDMLEQWFSIVSEQLFEPAWREFYVEKEVVQREWAFRYVNSPEGAAWLDLFATAYTAHPYRNPVIGWKSDMENYSISDAIAFHSTYYSPANAVCVLVGDITAQEAKRLASRYFERYPAGRRAPELVTAEPPHSGPRTTVHYLKGARTPLVRIGYHAARMGTKDFYALDALTMVLSAGRSARLEQNIVNKGKAVEAFAANPDNRYGGMVVIGGSPHDGEDLQDARFTEPERQAQYLKTCESLEEQLLAEVEALKTDLVSLRELERIRKLNQRDFIDSMRSNEMLASRLATLEVEVGWRYLEEYLDNIAAVIPEDIRQAANRHLRPENKTSVYVIPGGPPDQPAESYIEVRSVSGAAASRTMKTDTSVNHSRYPTPSEWKHPLSFERNAKKIHYPEAVKTAAGGATIFYLPDHELPLVDLTLLIKAGEIDVPDEKTGLTGILNESLIRGGTQKHTPAELAQVLDENAIQLSVAAREEETVINLSVLKEDWKLGLDLLRHVLTQPRFDPEVLSAVKEQARAGLSRSVDNASVVAQREAGIWRYQGHPYGRDPLKGLETIPAITSEDLRLFLRTYCVPSNMVAAASGDLDKAEILQGLEQLFASLPHQQAPERNLAVPPETLPVVTLIDKPGQVQSTVILTLPSVLRTHPDYWKISLLMDVLGGEDSFLYRRLRDDLGLVYATGFFQAYKWKAGMLAGYIGCKADQTRLALEETVKIMEQLRTEVPKEELERHRLDILNGFVFNVDTPAALVETYAHYCLRNEPLDTLERIQDAFMTATQEELEGLAQRFLDPNKLQIFVVGDTGISVKKSDGSTVTLGQDVQDLAQKLGLPFKEMAAR